MAQRECEWASEVGVGAEGVGVAWHETCRVGQGEGMAFQARGPASGKAEVALASRDVSR